MNNFIISYPKDTESQMKAYIDTLHPLNDSRAYIVISMGENCSYMRSGNAEFVKDNFMKWYEDYDNDCENCFVSLNQFNPFKHKNPDIFKVKTDKNLFSIDVLMFDIDAKGENLCGLENQLVQEMLKMMLINSFPIPNAFSYSGSGGIHFYYTITPVSFMLANGIKALKYKMAKKIEKMLEQYSTDFGMDYEIDTSVFDNVRNDRMPGTMNPKTGRMCEFFKMNVPLYTFQKLLNFEEINRVDWDKFLKSAKKDYLYNKQSNSTVSVEEFLKRPAVQKTTFITPKKPSKRTAFENVAKTRVENMLELGKYGYGFNKCRVRACFAFRQMCRQAGLDTEEELKLLHELNSYFWQPLDENALLKQTDSKGVYKISNDTLAEYLKLNPDMYEWNILFTSNYKPIIKSYGLTKKELLTVSRYIEIAKLKYDSPKIKNKEIMEKTGFPADAVKRIGSRLNQNKESIEVWKDLDYKDSKNLTFIKDFLSNNKLYIRKDNTDTNKSNQNTKVIPEEIKVIVFANDKRFNGSPKLNIKTIPTSLLKIDYKESYNNCERFLKSYLSLSKKAKADVTYWDRNPNHKKTMSLYNECQNFVLCYIQCFRKLNVSLMQELFDELSIPIYYQKTFILGHICYSNEYLENMNWSYEDSINQAIVPEPSITPIYQNKISNVPELKVSDKYFRYSKDVLMKYLYENFQIDIYSDKYDEFSFFYDTFHKEYQKTYNSYKFNQKEYLKYAQRWNYKMCNTRARYINMAVEKMNQIETMYNKELNEHDFPDLIKLVDLRTINHDITMSLIQNCDDARNAVLV